MIVATVFILIGLFFFIVSAIGIVRLPDVFTRSHALSITDTMGVFFTLTGIAIHHGFSPSTVKIIFILGMLFLANPTASHAILRAALVSKVKPWEKKKKDEYSG